MTTKHTPAIYLPLLKSHVRASTRVTPSGKATTVREHERKGEEKCPVCGAKAERYKWHDSSKGYMRGWACTRGMDEDGEGCDATWGSERDEPRHSEYVDSLHKSHVRAHTRMTRSGKAVTVKEHEDGRTAKEKDNDGYEGSYRPTPGSIDHEKYPKRLRTKTEAELRYIIKDAGQALHSNPEGRKAGYYADEINYASMELHRRRKESSMQKSHVAAHTETTRSGKVVPVKEFERKTPSVGHRLTAILADDYGVGPVHAPKEAVEWAAGRMIKEGHSVKDAEAAVSENNALRQKHGKPLVYLPYQWHTAYTGA